MPHGSARARPSWASGASYRICASSICARSWSQCWP